MYSNNSYTSIYLPSLVGDHFGSYEIMFMNVHVIISATVMLLMVSERYAITYMIIHPWPTTYMYFYTMQQLL
jgi:hypothetical protein